MRELMKIAVFLLLPTITFSQDEISNRFDFGFYLEGNRSFIEGQRAKTKDVQINSSFGMGLGILMDYKITKNISIATKAGLSFSNSSVDYYIGDLLTNKHEVYPMNLDFRLHGKYAFGKRSSRLYLLAGPSIMLPLQSDTESSTTFGVDRNGFSLDAGIGFDNHLDIFRFAPEIRYSYGLNDINSTPWLSNLYLHRLTLTLNFLD